MKKLRIREKILNEVKKVKEEEKRKQQEKASKLAEAFKERDKKDFHTLIMKNQSRVNFINDMFLELKRRQAEKSNLEEGLSKLKE